MENNNLIKKLNDFLQKDTGYKNESPKLIMAVRALLLLFTLYSIINSVLYISLLNNKDLLQAVVGIFVFGGLFGFSYVAKTRTSFVLLSLGGLVYTYISIMHLGWSSGAHLMLIPIYVLGFFCTYDKYVFKTIYSFILVIIYVVYFASSNLHFASPEFSDTQSIVLQAINAFIAFGALAIIVFVFTGQSRSLEGKLVAYNSQLQDEANTDALTGLYNRRKAKEYLNEILSPSNETCTSVCMCDIDFFKSVNDTYGHDVGDMVLQKLSSIMKKTLPESAFVARWGGEEFLIIFPACNGDDAFVHLSSLRSHIKEALITTSQGTFGFTLTYGLTEYNFKEDAAELIKEADDKLYLGKENGRDQIVF